MMNSALVNRVMGLGGRMESSTVDYLASSSAMNNVGKALETVSDWHPVVDILTPTADQLTDLAGCAAEAIPLMVTGAAIVGAGKLIQKTLDQKFVLGVDKTADVAKNLLTKPDNS